MDNFETETNIFRGEKKGMIVAILYIIIIVLAVFTSGDSLLNMELLKNLQSFNIQAISRNDRYSLLIYFLMILGFLIGILSCIANAKSYIELTSTCLIMRKPAHYPFLNMETLNIPYEDIDEIKIFPTKSQYNLILKKKNEFGKKQKITFYGLCEGDKINEELKKRGINSHIPCMGSKKYFYYKN